MHRIKKSRILSIIFISAFISICACGNNKTINEEAQEVQEVLEESNDNSRKSSITSYNDSYVSLAIYDYIDPDTGVHYLIFRDNAYSSGRGGITPRFNSDGTLMVEEMNIGEE